MRRVAWIVLLVVVNFSLFGESVHLSPGGTINDYPGVMFERVRDFRGQVLLERSYSNGATINEISADQGSVLEISGMDLSADPGMPMIPQQNIHLELDGYCQISSVVLESGNVLTGFSKTDLVPGTKRVIWDGTVTPGEKFAMNPEVYQSKSFYPSTWYDYVSGFDGEKTHIYLHFYPVQWNPITKEVKYLKDFTIRVGGKSNCELPKFEKADTFNGNRSNAAHILISPPLFADLADSIADFHSQNGLETDVFITDDIYSQYIPAENPTEPGIANMTNPSIQNYNYANVGKIVAFMRDNMAHPNLESVTLLGSGEFVPPSYYFFNVWVDEYNNWCPSDHYYSSPDYDWVDNYVVNRIPVHSEADLSVYFGKMRSYVANITQGEWTSKASVSGGRPFESIFYTGEMINNHTVVDNLFDGYEISKYQLNRGTFNSPDFHDHFQNDDFLMHFHICHGSGPAIMFDGPGAISANNLLNYPAKDRVPIFVCIACMTGAFDTQIFNGGFDVSFSEGLIASKGAGIAYIGGARSNSGDSEFYTNQGNIVFTGTNDTYSALYNFFEAHRNMEEQTIGKLYRAAKDKFLEEENMNFSYNKAAYVRFVAHCDGALPVPTPAEINSEVDLPNLDLLGSTTQNYDGITIQTLDISSGNVPEYGISDNNLYDIQSVYFGNVQNQEDVSGSFTLNDIEGECIVLNKAEEGYEYKEQWHYSFIRVPEFKVIDGEFDDWTAEELIGTDQYGDQEDNLFDLYEFYAAQNVHNGELFFALATDDLVTDIGSNVYWAYYMLAFDDGPGGFTNNYSENQIFPQNVFAGFDNASINKVFTAKLTVNNGQIVAVLCDFYEYDEEMNQWQILNVNGMAKGDDGIEVCLDGEYLNVENCKVAAITSFSTLIPAQNWGVILDAIPSSDLCPTSAIFGQDNAFSISEYITLPFNNSVSNDMAVVNQKKKAVLSNYPNPFNPVTNIYYNIDKASNVNLSIYNVKGELVKLLKNNEYCQPGNYQVTWDGRNDAGFLVGSGVYFTKISHESQSSVRKMLLMK